MHCVLIACPPSWVEAGLTGSGAQSEESMVTRSARSPVKKNNLTTSGDQAEYQVVDPKYAQMPVVCGFVAALGRVAICAVSVMLFVFRCDARPLSLSPCNAQMPAVTAQDTSRQCTLGSEPTTVHNTHTGKNCVLYHARNFSCAWRPFAEPASRM